MFDGGFEPLVKLLLANVDANFLPTSAVDDHGVEVVDHNRKSDSAFLSPHRDDLYLNELTDFLVRLIGLPNRHYSEVIEINRYNETGFFAIHYDFLSDAALLDKSPFHGCQRVATAVLQLTDVEGGETVFIRDRNFKGGFDAIDLKSDDVLVVPSKRGRLLAWFNLHPDTEEIDYSTWHGSMPVAKGQKIAATFYLRNCSQADNSRRRAQFEDFLKEAPAPSTGVDHRRKSRPIPEEYLKDMGGGGDRGKDKDGEYFDPVEDAEYMKDLRRYRKIRDAGGNTTEALIAAGFEEEHFPDLDGEVLILDVYEEKMEADKEFESLRKYNVIKKRGGDVVGNLKEAGFNEEDFAMLDKELEIFADKIGGSDDAEGKDDVEAESIPEMDEEMIRSFEEQLREHGLAENEDEGEAESGRIGEGGDVGMDEESIREYERLLREEQRGGDCAQEFDSAYFMDDDDDDFDFEDGDFDGFDDDYDDDDDDDAFEWDAMEDEGLGGSTAGKVIPPGSRAQEVEAR